MHLIHLKGSETNTITSNTSFALSHTLCLFVSLPLSLSQDRLPDKRHPLKPLENLHNKTVREGRKFEGVERIEVCYLGWVNIAIGEITAIRGGGVKTDMGVTRISN